MCVRRLLLLIALGATMPVRAGAQGGPIIDMHFHGASTFNEREVAPIAPWLEAFDEWGVELAVLTSFPHQLEVWAPADPDRLIPSLWFPCMRQFVAICFPGDADLPDVEWVRSELEAGRLRMIGEVGTQLLGLAPDDPALDPYFALAAEFDVPFALHLGPGPFWAVGEQSIYAEFPEYSASAGNPLRLEPVLRKYPGLRLYVMHAGWPMLAEMLAILWHNPNVYVDTGHLQVTSPRSEYYTYLRRIVDAGFGDRIMYGSDVGFRDFGSGIEAIQEAEFLTADQKRDILYNNAARFLRLGR